MRTGEFKSICTKLEAVQKWQGTIAFLPWLACARWFDLQIVHRLRGTDLWLIELIHITDGYLSVQGSLLNLIRNAESHSVLVLGQENIAVMRT